MVSAQSIHNLTSVFERVARAAILRSPDDSWELVAAAPPTGKGEQLLVITTSSFGFRLLTIFQVPDTEANRAYFLPPGAQGPLLDGFAEIVNLCCGALNREFGAAFPQLAMSVPCSLSAECLEYLGHLAPAHIQRLSVSINNTVSVSVTLCICCSAPIEIPLPAAAAAQANGELEMF